MVFVAGEAEPEDLSQDLIVQLGSITEELNRTWYERNSGYAVDDVQRKLRHPIHKWMRATLDGRVRQTGAVFKAKFMLPWNFSEEGAAEKHIAQVQHNMWVSAARAEKVKRPNLPPQASENLRYRLISELEQLENAETLAPWAHRALPLKNQLSAQDAQAVEGAFAARLAHLRDAAPVFDRKNRDGNRHGRRPNRADPSAEAVTVIGKPVRERDRDHLRFVATQPCLVCGRTPSDPHHIKFAEQQAMGRRVSDRFTVPICRLHHRELHRRGDERAWWQKQGIDPLGAAATLWARTHPVELAAADGVGEADRVGNPKIGNESGGADWLQNNETNPILRPEA
jgi:hypothetical protein